MKREGESRMLDKPTEDRLTGLFERLLAFYKKFLKLESEKFADVSAGSLDRLDGRIRDEQAYLLKARGLEQERLALEEQAGCPGAAFRELIPLFEPERRETAQKYYEDLSSVIRELKETNRECNRLTGVKLHQAKNILEKLQDNPELKAVYDSKIRAKTQAAGLFSKKV